MAASFWQMREVSGGDGSTVRTACTSTSASATRRTRTSCASSGLPAHAGVVQRRLEQFLTVTEPGGEPRLAAARQNGQMQLTLTGKQGSRYAIETSTALPNWNNANLTSPSRTRAAR
jgi:hypothetical protein